MQMFAIDSFYLCVMAVAELVEPNHCPAAPAGPSPAWPRRDAALASSVHGYRRDTDYLCYDAMG